MSEEERELTDNEKLRKKVLTKAIKKHKHELTERPLQTMKDFLFKDKGNVSKNFVLDKTLVKEVIDQSGTIAERMRITFTNNLGISIIRMRNEYNMYNGAFKTIGIGVTGDLDYSLLDGGHADLDLQGVNKHTNTIAHMDEVKIPEEENTLEAQ